MVDVAACLTGSGSAWVASSGALAIAVDSAAVNAMSTYTGAPPSLRDMHGHPLLSASGSVAWAPLVYSNYYSWTTSLAVQNTSQVTSVLKITIMAHDGSAYSVRQMGPLRPGASMRVDVAAIAGVPFEFVGAARVESYSLSDAPVATPWLSPEPTSTPHRTPGPRPPWGDYKTRTPGSPVPVTPGTEVPTSTPTETRVPGPTATPLLPIRLSLYLPLSLR
jgi:hypothetical protein